MAAELVRVKLDTAVEVSLGRGFAERRGLTVLDKPATHNGRTLRAKYPVDLRGKDLDAALEAADLPTSGKAEEKRQRLSSHQTSPALSVGETTTNT